MLSAGQDIQVAAGETQTWGAGKDLSWAVGGSQRIHTGQAIGVLAGAVAAGDKAAGKGITLIADQGDIEIQAQADTLQVAAKQDVSIQSKTAHIDWAAAKRIVLSTAGGASITIEGGNITTECPGTITIKAGTKSFVGAETYAVGRNAMPGTSNFDEELKIQWPFDGSPVKNRAFEITRSDGTVVRGKTDNAGSTGLQKSDFFEEIKLRLLPEK